MDEQVCEHQKTDYLEVCILQFVHPSVGTAETYLIQNYSIRVHVTGSSVETGASEKFRRHPESVCDQALKKILVRKQEKQQNRFQRKNS